MGECGCDTVILPSVNSVNFVSRSRLTLLTCGCKTVPSALFENLGLGRQLATAPRIECQVHVRQDVRALLLPVVDKTVGSEGVRSSISPMKCP